MSEIISLLDAPFSGEGQFETVDGVSQQAVQFPLSLNETPGTYIKLIGDIFLHTVNGTYLNNYKMRMPIKLKPAYPYNGTAWEPRDNVYFDPIPTNSPSRNDIHIRMDIKSIPNLAFRTNTSTETSIGTIEISNLKIYTSEDPNFDEDIPDEPVEPITPSIEDLPSGASYSEFLNSDPIPETSFRDAFDNHPTETSLEFLGRKIINHDYIIDADMGIESREKLDLYEKAQRKHVSDLKLKN